VTTKRTLLIGASSPLGRAILSELADSSRDIVPASRSGSDRTDVTDRDSIRRLFEGPGFDEVVYLASPARPIAEGVIEAHTAGLADVLERAGRAGVGRFVLASSAAVYGPHSATPMQETSPRFGTSDYSRLKIASEDVLESSATHGMSTLALRIFNVFGPGFGGSLINRLQSSTEVPELQLSADFVRGYAAVNVGTGVGVSNLELAALASPGAFVPSPSDARSVSVADVRLAEAVLGSTPPNRVAEALTVGS
jgi:UDP-glucose 4-epimerase